MNEPIAFTTPGCAMPSPCLSSGHVLVGVHTPCPACAPMLERVRFEHRYAQVLDWPYWLSDRIIPEQRDYWIKLIREDRKRRKAERSAAKARSVPQQGGLRRELHQIQRLVLKAQLGQPAAGYGAALTEASVRLCNLIELVDESDAMIAAKQQAGGGSQ